MSSSVVSRPVLIRSDADTNEWSVRYELCPRCGCEDYREWTIGSAGKQTSAKRDPNKRTCENCKCEWFAAEIVKPGSE